MNLLIQEYALEWNREVNSLHISVNSPSNNVVLRIERAPGNKIETIQIKEGLERVIISKSFSDERSIKIFANTADKIDYLPVLDRAHFPVAEPSLKNYLN